MILVSATRDESEDSALGAWRGVRTMEVRPYDYQKIDVCEGSD